MFMVLLTTTADENRSQGAPVAHPATGKRGQRCRTPPASGTADLIKHRAAGLFSPQSPMAPQRRRHPRRWKPGRGAAVPLPPRIVYGWGAGRLRRPAPHPSTGARRAAALSSYQMFMILLTVTAHETRRRERRQRVIGSMGRAPVAPDP